MDMGWSSAKQKCVPFYKTHPPYTSLRRRKSVAVIYKYKFQNELKISQNTAMID